MAELSTGSLLRPSEDQPGAYLLEDEPLRDGEVVEVLTESGWVSGHFRQLLHPETGQVAFEIHVLGAEEGQWHLRVYLPEDALLRRPASLTVPTAAPA